MTKHQSFTFFLTRMIHHDFIKASPQTTLHANTSHTILKYHLILLIFIRFSFYVFLINNIKRQKFSFLEFGNVYFVSFIKVMKLSNFLCFWYENKNILVIFVPKVAFGIILHFERHQDSSFRSKTKQSELSFNIELTEDLSNIVTRGTQP